MKHSELTDQIISAFFEVYNDLGYGFLETIYASAMEIVCLEKGLQVQTELPIRVCFRGKDIGHYSADLVVNDLVLVELKAARSLCEDHSAQVLNYLRAMKYELGLLLNFGPRPQIKRFVFDNDRKRKSVASVAVGPC
jgi:GxxExxY protein